MEEKIGDTFEKGQQWSALQIELEAVVHVWTYLENVVQPLVLSGIYPGLDLQGCDHVVKEQAYWEGTRQLQAYNSAEYIVKDFGKDPDGAFEVAEILLGLQQTCALNLA